MNESELARELGVWRNPWTSWWEFSTPGGTVGRFASFGECLEAAMEWHVGMEEKQSTDAYE